MFDRAISLAARSERRIRRLAVSLFVSISTLVGNASATTLAQRMSLERVVDASERIVVGKVLDVVSGRDEQGVPSTWITLEVLSTLRGHAADTITIKQFGVVAPLADGTLFGLAGLPSYRVGEESVIFLRGESSRGFTSPAGLADGIFKIDRTHGAPLVGNDAAGRRPEGLERFLERVKRLADPDH
jgi:hypothetical protein